MKKIILNSLIIAILLAWSPLAFAEETTTTANVTLTASTTKPRFPLPPKQVREERKEEVKDRMEDAKSRLASTTMRLASTTKDIRNKIASSSEDRMEKRQEKIEDRRENIKRKIEERFRKMFQRFQATIDRERGIMDKINNRITKVKEAGGTPTEAQKYTAEAKVSLDSAQTALNLLKATATSTKEIEAQLNASTTEPKMSKETLEKLKTIGQDIEKHLKNAHKSLESAVKSLRGMSQAKNPNATTTGSSTGTTTSSN